MKNDKKIVRNFFNNYLLMNIIVGFLEGANNPYIGEIIKYSF